MSEKTLTPSLLTPVNKVLAAGSKRFVAKESFTRENGFCFWHDFKDYFLDKVEENVADVMIAIHHLEKDSWDELIRKELSQKREEIFLAHFFDLFKKQSKGQKGDLLVNGYTNIAFIRDKNGKLCTVDARWFSDRGWDIDANSVGNPNVVRLSGSQVLSHDC